MTNESELMWEAYQSEQTPLWKAELEYLADILHRTNTHNIDDQRVASSDVLNTSIIDLHQVALKALRNWESAWESEGIKQPGFFTELAKRLARY